MPLTRVALAGLTPGVVLVGINENASSGGVIVIPAPAGCKDSHVPGFRHGPFCLPSSGEAPGVSSCPVPLPHSLFPVGAALFSLLRVFLFFFPSSLSPLSVARSLPSTRLYQGRGATQLYSHPPQAD